MVINIIGTLPWTFRILNVIECGVNKWLVNTLAFKGALPCRIYRTVARVYPAYLHFETRILHTATMEDKQVAKKRAQKLGYCEGCGYMNE